jgi:hypothetical protein
VLHKHSGLSVISFNLLRSTCGSDRDLSIFNYPYYVCHVFYMHDIYIDPPEHASVEGHSVIIASIVQSHLFKVVIFTKGKH